MPDQRGEVNSLSLGVTLSSVEAQALADAFGVAVDALEAIAAIAQAALDEYSLFFSRRRMAGTLRDVREHRLAALLSRGVPGAAEEATVARLFALTPGQARTLLAGTRARYLSELRPALAGAVSAALRGPGRTGRGDDDEVWFRATSSLVAFMRELVASAPDGLPPIQASARRSGTYTTRKTTLEYVCAHMDVPAAEVEALA